MSDNRDWTVVLREPCTECGHDVRDIPAEQLGERLHQSIETWTDHLIGPGAVPSERMSRPSPSTWSSVEYACHVADVMDLFQHRIYLMLTEDSPMFESWDPDAAATQYAGRSPEHAVQLLRGASNRLGDVFDTMAPHLWERAGHRADGAAFTVLSLSRYFMHDNLHHLHDVTRDRA